MYNLYQPRWSPKRLGLQVILWVEGYNSDNVWDTGAPGKSLQTYKNKAAYADLTQATKSYQPVDSTQNGRETPKWVSSPSSTVVGTANAGILAAMAALHNGNGGTFYAVLYPSAANNYYVLATLGSALTTYGVAISSTSGSKLNIKIYNGSGAALVNATSAGSLASGRQDQSFQYSESMSPKVQAMVNGTVLVTSNTSGSPAANSASTCYLGASYSRTVPVLGEVPLAVAGNVYWPAQTMLNLRAYGSKF